MDIQPALYVRHVARGESLADLIDEAKARTWQDEAEHLVLKLEDGSRVMMRGGRDGIRFAVRGLDDGPLGRRGLFAMVLGHESRVVRIYGHTHPEVTGPSDGDLEALGILGQTRSYLVEIGGSTVSLLSDRNRAARPVELPRDVPVGDVIPMRPGLGLAHAPGMVAVLKGFAAPDPAAYIGRVATIRHEDGRVLTAEVEAARSHGATISFFFRDLTPADVPIGCRVSIDA